MWCQSRCWQSQLSATFNSQINPGYLTMDDGTHVRSFSSASGLSNLFSQGVLLLPVRAVSCAVCLSLCSHLLASHTAIPSSPRNPSLLFPFTIFHLQNQSLGITSRLMILGCSWGHCLYPKCHFWTCNKKNGSPSVTSSSLAMATCLLFLLSMARSS